jgi:acyl-CoA reductase-like NAD-dependent aldehyde dehydrogenase
MSNSQSRIDIKKTYKLFIGGAFPRSESGRTYEVKDSKGNFIANPSLASRKDLRDCVVAARSAHSGWAGATAFNRGQILYRIAEMMEGRSAQFVDEIVALEGVTPSAAKKQVEEAIDLWVWYSGWCDKIGSIYGSTNAVSGSFYNFTIPESLGVVAVFAPAKPSLLGLVQSLAPVLAGGNTAIVIASEKYPLGAITLSEALGTSDVPGGVINILTGSSAELAPWIGSHMDIDGIDASGLSTAQEKELRIAGADNLKRIFSFKEAKSPQRVLSFMENKTVWHPIGV